MAGYTMNGTIVNVENAGTGRANIIIAVEHNDEVTLTVNLQKIIELNDMFPGGGKFGNAVANVKPQLMNKRIAIAIQI
jgi:hypothetical protein